MGRGSPPAHPSFHSGLSAPNNPVSGQLWFDTQYGKTMVFNGSAWIAVPSATGVFTGHLRSKKLHDRAAYLRHKAVAWTVTAVLMGLYVGWWFNNVAPVILTVVFLALARWLPHR